MARIPITPAISIDEAEVEERFARASGPGGQNVNKVETAVQLRFDAAHSPSLPEPVRDRLLALAGSRLTDAGELLISASTHRERERNREDALARLVALIRQAAEPPRPRYDTRVPRSSRRERLEGKRRRGETKALRRTRPEE